MNPKWLVTSLAATVVALVLFLFLPLSYAHHTTFVMEPAEQASVRAETEGFVGSVLAREGDFVRRGDLLAGMRGIELEQKRDSLRSQIALVERKALTPRAHGDTPHAVPNESVRS